MSAPVSTYSLLRHREHLAVARLGPGAEVPRWASAGTLLSVTATATETSVVCAASDVPRKVPHAGPFTAYVVDGTLDFALTGVLHALTGPLAADEVPVFVISTHDTDWLLVPVEHADRAAEAWRRSGHEVHDAPVPA